MRILGIVAEYDPFHRGHAWHLAEARRQVQPDWTLVALSGCIKQRGEFSLLSPHDRAASAVEAGADAVFELPLLWTVRDAEHYALGAVSLLAMLGCTHLAFGAETDRLNRLQQLADFLEDEPPEAFQQALRAQLAAGRGYPAALAAAVHTARRDAAGLLDQPNNILAVCYLRAIRRLKATITPVLVQRTGRYHAPDIDPGAPSASALRDALLRGHYGPALAALPEYSARRVQQQLLDGHALHPFLEDALLLSSLRRLSAQELRQLPDVSEGLEYALEKAARLSVSRSQLLNRLTGKRYSASRISRLCACAQLGITAQEVREAPLPSSAALLAFRINRTMMQHWKGQSLPIFSSSSGWQTTPDYQANLQAYRCWALCRRLPDTLPFTQRLFTLRADPENL